MIAVDLPGYGDSPRQPDSRGNTPHDLALAGAELLDQLGIHTRWVTLTGCGHVPMVDDPHAVTELLLAASNPNSAGELGKPLRRR